MRYNANLIETELGSFKTFTEEPEEAQGGLVAWTQELETGNEVLDQQHRRYIDLLNEFLMDASEPANTDEKVCMLAESFDFLRHYAEEHFSTEETIMKDTEFPDYESHREEHLYFLRHVEGLYRQMQAEGISSKLRREVNFYAIEWFIDHILGSDMILVEYLKFKH